jgi:hypothetical protein
LDAFILTILLLDRSKEEKKKNGQRIKGGRLVG